MKHDTMDILTVAVYTLVVLGGVVISILPDINKKWTIRGLNDSQNDIVYHINDSLKIFKHTLTADQITQLTTALEIGTSEFDIDYHDVFAIIVIESEFNPNAINYNRNKTTDTGITQINAPQWYNLSWQSINLLKKYGQPLRNIHNKNDIILCVLNSYVFLNWQRIELNRKQVYSYRTWIQSYNVGLNGALSNSYYFKMKRERYFQKFIKARELYN
jgi:hypothetical protein